MSAELEALVANLTEQRDLYMSLAVEQTELINKLESQNKDLLVTATTQAMTIKKLEQALDVALDALQSGLWDYGPGQDEHDKCEEIIAKMKEVRRD